MIAGLARTAASAKRMPIEIAAEISRRYGHDFDSVFYIPALALIGRLRLGALTDDVHHLRDIERIVAPYYEGKKQTLGPRFGNPGGQFVFGELARTTGRPRYVELARVAAD